MDGIKIMNENDFPQKARHYGNPAEVGFRVQESLSKLERKKKNCEPKSCKKCHFYSRHCYKSA